MASNSGAFVLPSSLVSPADLGRVRRELETLDEQLHQAQLRAKAGAPPTDERATPKRLLQEVAAANQFDLADRSQRQALLEQLTGLIKTSPVVTISFAVDPSDAFMVKIVAWFRTNTHPGVLVRVGLQPSITAGCRVLTPGKLYDFSLRGKFKEQRPMLVKRLRGDKPRPASFVKAPTVEATA